MTVQEIDLGRVVGIDAEIEIGTVTTLAPGEQATVENVGEPTHAVLDFGIPQGPQGETVVPEGSIGVDELDESLLATIDGKSDKDHTHAAADVGALPLTGGEMHGAVVFDNNTFIFGKNSSGVGRSAFEPCTNDDRTTVGYGGYDLKQGNTSIYGNGINMQSRGNMNVYLDNGSMYLKGRILWGGTVTYANDAGSAGTITLTEDAADFQIMDIYYKTSDGVYGMTRVYMPNGKTANLTAVMYKHYSANDAVYCKVRDVVISGTSIYTTGYEGESSTTSVNSCSTYNVAGVILITRVVGYAY